MVGGQVAFPRAQHNPEETSENRGQEVTRAELLPPARLYAKGLFIIHHLQHFWRGDSFFLGTELNF